MHPHLFNWHYLSVVSLHYSGTDYTSACNIFTLSPLTSLTLTCQPTSGSCTRGAEHSTFSLHNSYPLLHGLCFFQRIHHCPPDPLSSPVDGPLFSPPSPHSSMPYILYLYIRPSVCTGKNPVWEEPKCMYICTASKTCPFSSHPSPTPAPPSPHTHDPCLY